LSFQIEIPGGTAEIRDADELTPRHRRATEVIMFQAPTLVDKLARASSVLLPDGKTVDGGGDGEVLELDGKEASLFLQLRDATIFAHLKSWNINEPLPTTVDDTLDIPTPVYDALYAAISATAVANQDSAAGFADTPANGTNDASPFVSSTSLPLDSPVAPRSTSKRTSPKTQKTA
jgi:hypothetical protein